MSISMREFEVKVFFSGGGGLFSFCYNRRFGYDAVGGVGGVAVCSGLVEVVSHVGFLRGIDEDARKRDMSTVEELT